MMDVRTQHTLIPSKHCSLLHARGSYFESEPILQMKPSFFIHLTNISRYLLLLGLFGIVSKSYAQPIDLETMEIHSAPISDLQSSQTNLLQGNSLRLKQSDTLGKLLEAELGVSNASFGQGVGVPVIRGLTGSRIRMLQNGLGSHDASSLSPDHAVAIEPIFAESIRISLGSENIRYGGNAIGGVVEVEDYRIPEQRMDQLLSGWLESRYDTNGEGTHSAFRLNLEKDWLGLTLGGFYRHRNDAQIPGQAIDADFIAQQFDLTDFDNAEGNIPNTDSKSSGGFVGASWLGEQAMAGMSVSYTDNQYGIPKGSHGLDPNHLDGLELILPQLEDISGFEDIFGPQALFPNIRIAMQNTRYDFKSEWYDPIEGIHNIRFQYAYVDYQHQELEGGSVFTHVKNDTGEGRFEIDHHFGHDFMGKIGVQWTDQDFSALGVETFVPETEKQSWGIFTTQNYHWHDWIITGGIRFEQTEIDPDATTLSLRGSALSPVSLPDKLSYDALSGTFSVRWNFTPEANVNLSFNYGQRSPDIQELLSFGPHLSTRTFDVGNVGLTNEVMKRIDLGLDWESDGFKLKLNSFYNQMDDYIYQQNTGVFYEVDNEVIRQRCVSEAECVPIYAYDQRDAEFFGYEAELSLPLYEFSYADLSLTLFSDYVRARFKADDVPRIPPLRYGAELGLGQQQWNASVRYARSESQHRSGAFEMDTSGYHLLSASADYHLDIAEKGELWLFVKANNLLNEEIRNSVSFLRNYAPEPGQSFVFGFRASY